MKKLLGVFLTIGMVVSMLSGCGSTAKNSSTSSATAASAAAEVSAAVSAEATSDAAKSEAVDGSKMKIALLIPGNLGDKSFFDGSKAALDEIGKKFGAKTDYVEMGTDASKYEATYEDYCEDGYDLILTISTAGDDTLKKMAQEYPDQKFINLDTDSEGFPSNVLPVTTKSNEMSALAGVVAALKAKDAGSNEIGFIGGMDIPGINYFLVGYIEGAQSVNPDIKVNASYVGSFTDSAKAKELAGIMYQSGVPIIYQAAGGSGLGVFEAAVAADKLAIGVDSDQALSLEEGSPDEAKHIVTSAEKLASVYAVDLVEKYIKGELTFGTKMVLGLKEGAVGIAKNTYYDSLMTDEEKKTVDDMEQKIISGEVKLTDTTALTTDQITKIRSSVAPQ